MTDSDFRKAGELHRGALGAPAIIFTVLAFAAPISVVVGTMPLGIAFGNGAGLPGAYLIAALILGCFVTGYAAMSRHVLNSGAFYAYIGNGLGRVAAAAAAMIALVAYISITVGITVIFGYFTSNVVADLANVNIQWWVWSLSGLALESFLSYRSVSIGAKVLGIALTLEVLFIVAFDGSVLVQRGLSALPAASFDPGTVFAGVVGVAFLYAFLSFIGIEATAIFGEEARDPERTVALASHGAVAVIGAIYVVSSWCLVAAYGGDAVQEIAIDDPGNLTLNASKTLLGTVPTHAMGLLLVSSLFAVLLAAHNSTSRYLFAIGRDGLISRRFAQTHPRWQSPSFASLVVAGCGVLGVAIAAILHVDPYVGFGSPLLALGTLGIVALQFIASIAIFVFFRRRRDRRVWTTVIAPILATGGLAAAVVLIVQHYDHVTGSNSTVSNGLPILLVLFASVGVGVALRLRITNPDCYSNLPNTDAIRRAAPENATEPIN